MNPPPSFADGISPPVSRLATDIPPLGKGGEGVTLNEGAEAAFGSLAWAMVAGGNRLSPTEADSREMSPLGD